MLIVLFPWILTKVINEDRGRRSLGKVEARSQSPDSQATGLSESEPLFPAIKPVLGRPVPV